MLGWILAKLVRRSIKRKLMKGVYKSMYAKKKVLTKKTYVPYKKVKRTNSEEQELFDILDRGVGRK